MARNTKREAERRVNLERPLTRFNLSGLSFEFAMEALGEGKRVVIEYDGCGRRFDLSQGTTNGYEIRARSEGDDVLGVTPFSHISRGANARHNTANDGTLTDWFGMIEKSRTNVVGITCRRKQTGLVLAKANDLDALRMKD